MASCFAYIELAACSESSRARTLACSVELVAGPPVTPCAHGVEHGVRAADITAAMTRRHAVRGLCIHVYLTLHLSERDALDGQAPRTSWLLADYHEKGPLVLYTPLIVEEPIAPRWSVMSLRLSVALQS